MWLFGRKGASGFSGSSTAEEVTDGINGTGLTAIVTGASSRIGAETARVLALRGVSVVMGVRNINAGREAKDNIVKEIPEAKVDTMELDLSSMASVRKFASDYIASKRPLNILINNAGVMATPFTLSKDNVELQFATNHLGHFLLTNLLLDTMKKTARDSGREGRIVNVASDAHYLTYSEGIRFDKLNDPSGYRRWRAYDQSKLANILHANQLSKHLKEDGANITANSVHPGLIYTNLFRYNSWMDGITRKLGKYFFKDVPQGAATTCYVALHPQVKGISGEYFKDSNLGKRSELARDAALAQKLWDLSVYLERADMFKYLGKLLAWKSRGPKDLIFRICLISAISSAFFTNDTSCVVLTEFVLIIARQHNLPPHPFLLALASSANIGSSATPIGNPQNLVIAVQSKITFGEFLLGILPAMIVGVFVNTFIIIVMYWKLLSTHKDEEDAGSEVVAEDDVTSHRFSPATMSHLSPSNSVESINCFNSPVRGNSSQIETLRNRLNSSENIQNSESARNSNDGTCQQKEESVTPRRVETLNKEVTSQFKLFLAGKGVSGKWKQILWKICVYLVTLGMLIALLFGLNMSWTAITAALALVVLDFQDARPSLEKVSYSLLIFFCGMFITVDGFNKTGIPSKLWDLMEPYSKIDHASGIAVLALVILVLSNLASNVPTVLLLGGRVAASGAAISASKEKKAWLILAWVSTVAGNLSLLGSAANLIVCEQARRAPHLAYNLTFWRHLKFGVPSTLIVTAIGLTLIR